MIVQGLDTPLSLEVMDRASQSLYELPSRQPADTLPGLTYDTHVLLVTFALLILLSHRLCDSYISNSFTLPFTKMIVSSSDEPNKISFVWYAGIG